MGLMDQPLQFRQSSMSPILHALLPIFLVIVAGWLARQSGFVDDRHWPGLEKVTYVVFFPAIVVYTLARADLSTVPVAGVGGALICGILSVAALLVVSRDYLERRLGIDGPSFTSVFQGATRWNTFVALAVTGSLFGPRGLATMAVAVAAMIPLLNVLAIVVLVRYAGGPPQTARQILRALATNPFIWSSALGLALNVTGIGLPGPTASFVKILGDAALATGLLVAGAGLDIRRLAAPQPAHAVSLLAKLLLLPIIATIAARLYGLGGEDLAVVAIASTVPTASGGYLLAKQMGGNAPLMAEIITVQTLVSLVSMPLMIGVLAGG